MAYTNALSTYKNTGISTASASQLVIMLYDGAIRHLDQSLELLHANMEKKDPAKIEKISRSILKAQEIIAELMSTLNMDEGGDVAKNLLSLYTWFHRELLEANIAQDIHQVTVVRNLMSELRDAWNEISSKNESSQPSSGLSIAL
ncbi:flagellar protein FliS [Spirochaetia bacterium]|nr:flagellar protein FliS [Spirochaetia bacterium]